MVEHMPSCVLWEVSVIWVCTVVLGAQALAGVRQGNELVEVAGQRVAKSRLEEIVPLLQAERSVEQPLSLVFEAQLFASTPERRSAADTAAAPALSKKP